MLPVDVPTMLSAALEKEQRAPDGLLHSSSHLLAPMRHVMLDLAGAPKKPENLTSTVRLKTGTFWHSWFEDLFRGKLFMAEVKLDPWMPAGWSGTADWLFYDDRYRKWVLGDLKTIKGEGMTRILAYGAKNEHLWQLSSYWYALRDAGLDLVPGFGVFYLPMNQVTGTDIYPAVMECDLIPEWQIKGVMEHRWEAVQEYLESLAGRTFHTDSRPSDWISGKLPPPAPREQKCQWSKVAGGFEVKLWPHYTSMWCPYSDELCPCGAEGTTKIGQYDLDGQYTPRKGYEDIKPTVAPSQADLNRRRP